MLRRTTLILVAVAIAACGATAERNAAVYEKQIQFVRAEAADAKDADRERAAEYQALLQKCTSDACVIAVAGFKTLGERTDGSSTARLPAPPYERDGAAKAKDWIGALGSIVVPGFNAWVAKVQSDNSVRQSEQQYEFLGSAIGSMADVANNAQPNITVGGDYVPGSQHIGDTITGDGNATHGSQVGDNVGRDQTGGDHVEDAVIGNDNRFDSDGPFDNVGNCNAGDGAPGGAGSEEGTGAPGGDGGGCAPPAPPPG